MSFQISMVMMLLSLNALYSLVIDLKQPSIILWTSKQKPISKTNTNGNLLVNSQATYDNFSALILYGIKPQKFTYYNQISQQSELRYFQQIEKESKVTANYYLSLVNNVSTSGIVEGSVNSTKYQNQLNHISSAQNDIKILPKTEEINSELYIFQKNSFFYQVDVSNTDFERSCLKSIGQEGMRDKNCPDLVTSDKPSIYKSVGKLKDKGFKIQQKDRENEYQVTLFINQKIIGSDFSVHPLSQLKTDLSQITIAVKNFKEVKTPKIKVSVNNAGNEIAFFRIQCSQLGDVIYGQEILVKPNDQEIFQTSLSKNYPAQKVQFKVSSPLTGQLYTFVNPVTIVKDSQWVSFSMNGSNFVQTSSISISVFIGAGIGALVLVVIGFAAVAYRRRKIKKQKLQKLSLQKLKQNNAGATTSDRQFLHQMNLPSLSLKHKMQSSTTLASTNKQISQPSQFNHSQQLPHPSLNPYLKNPLPDPSCGHDNHNDNEDKAPSLQDRLQIKQVQLDLDNLPKKYYKSGHRRTTSAVRILPEISQTIEISRGEKVRTFDSIQTTHDI